MIEPESTTPSQPAAMDVGSILKQARLRRGQSFEVVFQHTRIPKKFLEALENNRFDEFPAKVYLQGFLKGYCEHLNLEFEPLWAQIQPPRSKADTAKEHKDIEEKPQTTHTQSPATPPDQDEGEDNRSYLSVAVVIAVGALAFIAVIWGIEQKNHKALPPPPLSQRPPEALAPIVHLPEKMTLKVVFLNEAWVSLRCDDILRFEGRYPAGSTQTLSATKEYRLRTSTPGDLSIELDGKTYPIGSATRSASGEYVIRRT